MANADNQAAMSNYMKSIPVITGADKIKSRRRYPPTFSQPCVPGYLRPAPVPFTVAGRLALTAFEAPLFLEAVLAWFIAF